MARETLSLRGVERDYGIPRAVASKAIADGGFPAYRLKKRRYLIFRTDVENWIRRHAVRPRPTAEARVREVIERESSVRK